MKKKIIIISGGISKERIISLDTGKQVAKELRKHHHSVKIVEPNFQLLDTIKSFKPNIIFNALHGPCKALKPVMDKLSDEFKDKANFYYADIEDGGINTGSAAGIRGVPTVIIYKKGIEVDRKVGGVPEGHMKEFLDKNI